MNLPYPFDNASDVKPDAQGSISLIDQQGKRLARIPMSTAFELSPKAEGYGSDHGFRNGGGYGSIFGSGLGAGYGQGFGEDDGSGRGKSK